MSGKGGRALCRVVDSWESSSVEAPCEAMSGGPGLLWEGGRLASMPGKWSVPATRGGNREAQGGSKQHSDASASIL